jgi:anti-sigma factor RsiW
MKTEHLESACKKFEEDLVLYYYGEGSPAERARVENHLQSCGRCVGFLNDLSRLLPRLAEAKELPDSFWNAYYKEVLAKLAAQQESTAWWRGFFAPLRPWAVPAFATAVIATFALALVLERGMLDFQRERSWDTVPREVIVDSTQLEFFKSMDMLETLSVLEALDRSANERLHTQQS